MKTVRLYGELREKFGKEFHFDVKSPAEAIRALCVTVKGFEGYLRKHGEDAYKVFSGARNTSESLHDPISDSEVIRIAPVVQGSSGAQRIVVGVLMIVAAYFLGPAGAGAISAATQTTVYGMGASMILGGIAQLLSPQQSVKSGESAENTPSYNFNGPVNTTAQGHPVPLIYGRMIVGSAVISAGYTTK